MSAPFTPPFAKMAIHRETHSRSRCRERLRWDIYIIVPPPKAQKRREKILSTRRGWKCWQCLHAMTCQWHTWTHGSYTACTWPVQDQPRQRLVDEGGCHQVPLLAEELLTTGSGSRKENRGCLGMRPPHLYWQHWADLGFKNRTYEIEKE